MIEMIMVFALGFLSAGLLALLIVPAVNRRAERLARRRYEALFPLSVTDLAAERDHLRAEFAVMARGLEQRIEHLTAEKAAALEESGRRAFIIKDLEDRIAGHVATVAGAQRETTDTLKELAAARDAVAAAERARHETSEKLIATESELSLVGDDHARAIAEVNTRRIAMADLETRNTHVRARLSDTERALTQRLAELDAERRRAEERELRLSGERAEFAAMRERHAALESLHDDQRRRIEVLEASENDLAKRLTESALLLERRNRLLAERESTLVALNRKLAELEANWEAGGHVAREGERSLAAAVAALRSEKDTVERALAEAHAERAELQRVTADLKRSADSTSEAIAAENSLLLARIDEVATDIVRLQGELTPKARAKRPA